MSKIDLTSEEEKSQIEKVFSNAIDSLSDDDKKLPQGILFFYKQKFNF